MNKPANLDFYSSDFSPTVYGSKQEYIENNPIHSSLTDEDYKKIADFMLEFHEDNQSSRIPCGIVGLITSPLPFL